MIELLTGTGLAMAAGLNAYIPLLALGLAARFLDIVALPPAWAWLENEWVLAILGVLLVVEFFADKIPAVDTINDWLQTVVRPAAGGLAFGSGSTAQTQAVADPAEFFASNQWVPILSGVVLALGVHLLKMAARPLLNLATAGAAAPVVSFAEDGVSVAMAVLAIALPLRLVVAIPALVIGVVVAIRRYRGRRALDAAAPRQPQHPSA